MKEKWLGFWKSPHLLANLFLIFVALFCFLAGSVFFVQSCMLQLGQTVIIYLGSFLLIILAAFFLRKLPIDKKWVEIGLLILIIGLGLGFRIGANHLLKTQPFSDFATPNNVYLADANEIFAPHENSIDNSFFQRYYAMYPAWFPYMKITSGIYDMVGFNIEAIKVFNWILSVGTMLLLYWSSKTIFGKRTAFLATLFFACFPSLILYSNITTPDHITIFLIALWISTWVLMIKKRKEERKSLYWISVVHLLILASINYFKPLSVFGILVFLGTEVLYYGIPILGNKERRKQYFKKSVPYVLGMIILFFGIGFLFQSGLKKEIKKTTNMEVVDSTGLYLLWAYSLNEEKHYDPNVGTDILSEAMVKYSYDLDQIMADLNEKAKAQFINNLPYLPRILQEKFMILFKDDGDIFGFSNFSNNEAHEALMRDQYYYPFVNVSGAFWGILFLLIVVSLLKEVRKNDKNPFIIVLSLMLIGYFFILLLGGVQSRYKVLDSVPFCILAATCFSGFMEKNKKCDKIEENKGAEVC